MTPYPDAGFLITLLIRTNGTAEASRVVREIGNPCLITALHHFQARTFLAQSEHSPEEVHRKPAQEGLKLWQWFLDEGIFEMRDLDWNSAFLSAIGLVNALNESPPGPLLILHPIMAASLGATHFLSFDPRSRIIAKKFGLKVLPERL